MALCDTFLADMGIENMKANYSETAYASGDVLGSYTEKGYIIYYYRDYGVIGDCYCGDTQDVYGSDDFWSGGIRTYDDMYALMEGEYYLPEGHPIPALKERISFLVSDDGILAMEYQNPMEEVELLAENVELLAFDRVLESAYTYLEVMYDEEGSQLLPKETRIGCIELNLARVQNPNSDNDFTMLPVWDFRTGEYGRSVVTVNAIDGSIIDREAGH